MKKTDQIGHNFYGLGVEKFVSVFELKSKLSEHLDRVESGEQLVVTRNGKPIAKLVSFEQSRRPLGAFANALIWAPSAPKKFGRQFIRRFEGAGWAYYSPLSDFENQQLTRAPAKLPTLRFVDLRRL